MISIQDERDLLYIVLGCGRRYHQTYEHRNDSRSLSGDSVASETAARARGILPPELCLTPLQWNSHRESSTVALSCSELLNYDCIA
jgi:hypothetical protein